MLRAPAYPLITVDPYFSVWSMGDTLTGDTTRHWTGKPNTMLGSVCIDGAEYAFMGHSEGQNVLPQTEVLLSALSTTYVFEGAGICLQARFTSPLLLDNLKLLSRPVSYLALSASSLDGRDHTVFASVSVSEEICLNTKGQDEVITEITADGEVSSVSMGSARQPILAKSGDDLRIDWGYFYLSARGGTAAVEKRDMTYAVMKVLVEIGKSPAVFTFAYDDGNSVEYFGKRLKSLWNSDGTTIRQTIAAAFAEQETILAACEDFDKKLQLDAVIAGGEEYAELLNLVYRQAIAAHKLAIDDNGEVLWISKECFSNGCACTVDVTYPSIPLFLLFNTELVKGMLRPVFRFAESDAWKFPFAPHDVGQYPLLNGQVYAANDPEHQMPIEECGNMLLIAAAITEVEGNADFAVKHRMILEQWLQYLLQHGMDPDNQLCTDDFAGKLAHNCNLSLKAICAIGAFSRVYRRLGQPEKAEECLSAAKRMAGEWVTAADNGDGSFRLAFDKPGTFSLKYNMVWDKLFGLGLFPSCVMGSETASYARRAQPYGIPLDNRENYTKSDWLVWTATMMSTKEDFKATIHPLWLGYHLSPSRVPATDWYYTSTSLQAGFQNRTVQGGLFIKLLEAKHLCEAAQKQF